ncbi:hypothetical protein CN300_10440 [Bacillus thuringiensis]|uniref:hypothetical protein n=1 Tax=Bacillus thuringiensis TaxID=1428 RepID=UPI000BEDDFF5|nr:hypothetical protein [Bacillus thuringiensis]PEC17494.1 hypothetical protein CON19_07065 [Bacillus thuringiensis]PEV14648.1 hypothetical protein CN418_15130 [Bacillus thuringiensis]PEY72810.1 hypothetical protein CN355_12620 [Bacillus thuringiensis]PFC45710.1 hypothetical protein CN300_10440 [Bacillus thuringiensis]PGV69478.1 hypothetical protein COD96_12775 [Bacillus thuringiensis]
MFDLTKHFNNKGLSNINNYKSANLSITGYSIPIEDRDNKSLSFLDPTLPQDNIECFGQEIELINKVDTKEIEFYGVGIHGDTSSDVTFITNEEDTITKALCFSAYDYENAFFKENTLVYKSSYLYNCNSDNHFKFDRVGVIWKVSIKFKELISLKKIILPFHPGMHIFGINAIGEE